MALLARRAVLARVGTNQIQRRLKSAVSLCLEDPWEEPWEAKEEKFKLELDVPAERSTHQHRIAFFEDEPHLDGLRKQYGAKARPRSEDISKVHDELSLWDNEYSQTPQTKAELMRARLAALHSIEAEEATRVHRLAFHLDDFAQSSYCADRAHLGERVRRLHAQGKAPQAAQPPLATPAAAHSRRALFESAYCHGTEAAAAPAGPSASALAEEEPKHLHRVAFALAAYGSGVSAESTVLAAERVVRRSGDYLPSAIWAALAKVHDRRALFEHQFAQSS